MPLTVVLNDNRRDVRRPIQNVVPVFQHDVFLANGKQMVAAVLGGGGNINEMAAFSGAIVVPIACVDRPRAH